MECARGKENAFDRWLTSIKVDDYNKLKHLVLVEEFKRTISTEIRVLVDEHTVTEPKSAAVMDDAYALTHKKSGFSQEPYPVNSHWSGHNGSKPQCKPSNDDKGHLRRLPMISLTVVKLSKDSLMFRK